MCQILFSQIEKVIRANLEIPVYKALQKRFYSDKANINPELYHNYEILHAFLQMLMGTVYLYYSAV